VSGRPPAGLIDSLASSLDPAFDPPMLLPEGGGKRPNSQTAPLHEEKGPRLSCRALGGRRQGKSEVETAGFFPNSQRPRFVDLTLLRLILRHNRPHSGL
jgi:hypothetical protein